MSRPEISVNNGPWRSWLLGMLGPDPRPERQGIPSFSLTKPYASAKVRGTVRCNHRHRENLSRQKREKHRDRRFSYKQHDALVRRFGRRKADQIGRAVIKGSMTIEKAMTWGEPA